MLVHMNSNSNISEIFKVSSFEWLLAVSLVYISWTFKFYTKLHVFVLIYFMDAVSTHVNSSELVPKQVVDSGMLDEGVAGAEAIFTENWI